MYSHDQTRSTEALCEDFILWGQAVTAVIKNIEALSTHSVYMQPSGHLLAFRFALKEMTAESAKQFSSSIKLQIASINNESKLNKQTNTKKPG